MIFNVHETRCCDIVRAQNVENYVQLFMYMFIHWFYKINFTASSVYHLWEFIRDLLHDDKFCPKIIKWESEEEGIFRVVKSDEVAKQWGSKKNNRSKMTYEKLSRSLR